MDNKKILLAEDETHLRNTMSLRLRDAGYDVITASNGRQALDLANAEHPDLVIADYQMPELSGVELCQRLGQSAATQNIPAIVLSQPGYTLGRSHQTIKKLLNKPLTPRHLLSAIHEVLDQQAA